MSEKSKMAARGPKMSDGVLKLSILRFVVALINFRKISFLIPALWRAKTGGRI